MSAMALEPAQVRVEGVDGTYFSTRHFTIFLLIWVPGLLSPTTIFNSGARVLTA